MPTSCPTMSAGPKFECRWADGVQIKKPIEVSAPKYMEYLMDWIELQLDDENIFPQKLGTPFPPHFRDVIKTIFNRLFRVYAHIYHSHFQKIVSLKEETHLNTCFKAFHIFHMGIPTNKEGGSCTIERFHGVYSHGLLTKLQLIEEQKKNK